MAKRYYGPFTILRRVGAVAYQLDLPPSSRIHPVIHVSQLRAYFGENPTAHFRPIPPELEPEQGSESLVPTTASEDQNDELREFSNEEENETKQRGSAEGRDISTGKGKTKEVSTWKESLDPPLDLLQTTFKSLPLPIPSDICPNIQDQTTPLDTLTPAGKESSKNVSVGPNVAAPINSSASHDPPTSIINGSFHSKEKKPGVHPTPDRIQSLNPNLEVKVFSEPDGSDRIADHQRPKRSITKPSWTKNYVLSVIGP